MSEIDARKEYMKKWREKNKEYVREYNKQYRVKNPEKVKAAVAEYWKKRNAEKGEVKEE